MESLLSQRRVRRLAPPLDPIVHSINIPAGIPGTSSKRSHTPTELTERDTVGGVAFDRTAASYFVHSLPGIPNLAAHPTHPLNVYAGLLPSYPGDGVGGASGATGKDAEIFFLMAKARRSAGKSRVIFWFNGGPGCSSFDGAFMEVGPFRTVPATQTASGKVELKLVDGGWEEFATIIFIDQPPGTGLSYVPTDGYLHELDEASAHIIKFLQNFYQVFPELQALDTYLAGESYAGQYIPYFADALIKTNDLPGFNFKGIAIGNGWIDPINQYPGYAEFAYEKGLIKKGTPEGDRLDETLATCQVEIDKWLDPLSTPVNIEHCGEVMNAVSDPFIQQLNGQRVCMNVYDVRLVDEFPACGMNWPPDLPDVYSILRTDALTSALHATRRETAWTECEGRVASELYNRRSPASVGLIPGILEAGVQVMMFAGAEDLICNYKGIERMIEHITWGNGVGFGNATVNEWYLNDTQVGTWTSARNMTYVKVLDSSHMVGFDVPHVTNDMIMRFLDIDVSQLSGSTATWSSRVGDDSRVVLGAVAGEKVSSPVSDTGTDWDALYNAGSALMIIIILLSTVSLYFYFRARGRLRRLRGLPVVVPGGRETDSLDERVPLGEAYELDESGRVGSPRGGGKGRGGKGKGRARDHRDSGDVEDGRGEVVFALGDEEEDEGGFTGRGR